MKSKFGTALALVGVLLTGTAAAAINTQALISPTESTLGTAATTLLPADQTSASMPVEAQVPSAAATTNQNQVVTSSQTQPSANSTVDAVKVTTNSTSIASTSSNPSVVYGNPNPSNGDDDDDDEEEEDDDDDDDDDDDEDDD